MSRLVRTLLATSLTLGLFAAGTAQAALQAHPASNATHVNSPAPIRANAQEPFQSDHPARVSALYQENMN